jgi:hypothetical protein
VGEDLLERRLLVGEREAGRGGLYRRVVLLGVSVLEWEYRTGIWRVWTYEWACLGEFHWELRGEECRMEEVGVDRGDLSKRYW